MTRTSPQRLVTMQRCPSSSWPQVLLLVLFVTLVSLFDAVGASGGRQQLLLVSLDGFRADYIGKARIPFLREMMASGASVRRVKSAFPTLTFPNHWTLVTGRYPENHEIISNSMYDPVTKEIFSMSTEDAKWWNTSEPIWLTAMKQGLKAATYYWPGSAVELQGYRPVHWFPYSDDTPNLVKVNEVIRWLKDENIDLVALYFNQPDKIGHSKGPNANETLQMVEEMDSVIGYLMYMLRKSDLEDTVNVIVTSDHGMAGANNSSLISLGALTNSSCIEWSYLSAVGLIFPRPGCLAKVYEDLKGAGQNMSVYYKEELPARLHYNNSKRIPPIVIIPHEGFVLSLVTQGGPTSLGVHGYDNDLESMSATFVARGPAFAQGYVKDAIESVDIYPLMCRLLGITPQPYDGDEKRTADLLRPQPASNSASAVRACTAGLLAVFASRLMH